MPAKGSSKNPRYLGLDERGYPTWRAECGHVVLGEKAKRCVPCYQDTRKAKNYLGLIDGRNAYRSACGHIARSKNTKRCKQCVTEDKYQRHPYSAGYYPIMSRANGEPQRRVHIDVAEKALGRKLKKNEVVHHLNMDKFDWRNCNLLICDRSYHQYLHHAMALRYAQRCAPPNTEGVRDA